MKPRVTYTKDFARASASVRRGAAVGVQVAAHDLLAQSVPLAPLDLGDLRRSGSVDGPRTDGNRVLAVVGYGEPYAVVQHENLSFHHDEGQAKYLEEPARRNAERYATEITRRIREATR